MTRRQALLLAHLTKVAHDHPDGWTTNENELSKPSKKRLFATFLHGTTTVIYVTEELARSQKQEDDRERRELERRIEKEERLGDRQIAGNYGTPEERLNKDMFWEVYARIYSSLDHIDKIVVDGLRDESTQTDIANKVGISQQAIAKRIKKIQKKFKELKEFWL